MNLLLSCPVLISATFGAAVSVTSTAVNTTNTNVTNHTTSHIPKKKGMWDKDCDGCRNGYCYSSCFNTLDQMAWCYGTSSFSQSYRYNKCESDYDCHGDQCNACAGPCF